MTRTNTQTMTDQPERAVSEPCEDCGNEADVNADRIVARYPALDGAETVRCNDCYADLLAVETSLSEQEAAFAAGYLAGMSYADAGELAGISTAHAGTLGSRIREKREKAFTQLEQSEKTIDVLEHW